MKTKISSLATLFIALALMLGSVHEAEAKRLGGGSSFGSKPSYSAPYQRAAPSSAPTSANSQPNRSASQQQAANQNQAARQNWAGRGGLMGMLGGLALGGLLGSMFFGGAFENFNFMDILLFGGMAYLLYRLFAARTRQQTAGNSHPSHEAHEAPAQHYQRDNTAPAGFNTDVLFNKGKSAGGNGFQTATNFNPANVPAGFDSRAFLNGAENAFRHLQAAWDSRDLADIRGLTTDKVFAEIQDQLRASNTENKTEILKLTTELLDVREVGSYLEAVVLFDTLIRENGEQDEQVKEVWHFIKPVNSTQPKWFLDGIQQLQE